MSKSINLPRRPYRDATFLLGAGKLTQLPDDSLVEVAFAGRSNAGKSSALNCLTGQRKLARTSKTPGRTQEINFFTLRAQQYLVDLPGYGYAKVSAEQSRRWQATLGAYLRERRQLTALVLLMDIRHPLTPHDWTLIEQIASTDVALHILLTKADKLGRNLASSALSKTVKSLEDANVDASLQLFSALNRKGVDDLSDMLDSFFDLPAMEPAADLIS